MKTGIITEASAWLYADNLTDRTDEIFMGWAVGIKDVKDGWMEIVTHYGYEGYLKEDSICFCGPEELYERDRSGQTLLITRDFADILDRPDVRGRVLVTLCRGAFLTGLSEIRGGFRRVRLFDGREGYAPCIACDYRKENDGYLYNDMPRDYFLNQGTELVRSEEQYRRSLISSAIRYLGTQYRWAGKSPEGIDCSGLTFMCYLMSGKLIYRDAKIKSGYPIRKISMEKIKPGDLLYFPGHIAMYAGDGKYIHATGNAKNFGCVRNSLLKKDPDYREDLAVSLLMAGSIWE